MQVQPYLFFNGRSDEAIAFYGKTLGAKVNGLMRFKDSPETMASGMVPQEAADKVMHANVQVGEHQIMMSDGECQGSAKFEGVSLALMIDGDDKAEKIFAALGNGGQIQMPMSETFFASRFGMVADKFGVKWMVMAGQKH